MSRRAIECCCSNAAVLSDSRFWASCSHYAIFIASLCICMHFYLYRLLFAVILSRSSGCNQVAVCQPLLQSYLIWFEVERVKKWNQTWRDRLTRHRSELGGTAAERERERESEMQRLRRSVGVHRSIPRRLVTDHWTASDRWPRLDICPVSRTFALIRYDTRCDFNVRSKANTSQINLPHGTDN